MDPSLNPGPRAAHGSGLAVAGLEEDERWSLVLRVAGSPHFVKAQQLREILLFVCQRTLADSAVVIREHEIGCTVLGRKPDFNTHEDTIVRVQFGHLRKRLDAYFAAEGRDEPVRIVIPKGAYVPRFEAQAPPEAPVPEPVLAPPPSPPAPERKTWIRRSWERPAVFLLILTALAAVLLFIWIGSRGRRDEAGNAVWARMFASRQPLNIVVADTCLVMLQDILDTDIPLTQYIDGNYPKNLLIGVQDPALRSALQLISARQYSSLGDVGTASKLLNLSRRYGEDRALIRYARYLSVREFKTGNFVLLGSRRGIPWVQLFENQLNFLMEQDPTTRLYAFRNRSPRPGERQVYGSSKAADGVSETFADIAFLPNLGGTGYVMILAGIGMEAMEAAGDLTSGDQFGRMLSGILSKNPNLLTSEYFEILVRTRVVAGVSNSSQVVTYRVLQPAAAGDSR